MSGSYVQRFFSLIGGIDFPLLISAVLISCAGLITMDSFSVKNAFFERQIVWISISLAALLIASLIDYRLFRRSSVITSLFVGMAIILVLVRVVGSIALGAQSRFDFGAFAIQPSDPAKLILIMILAKYFAKRHVDIANIKHILISGFYTAVFALPVLLQPDLGTAIILGLIWFGIVVAAGITKKHLAMLFVLGAAASVVMWMFVLHPYQKQRVMTFIHPLADVRGGGYNVYQSMVAVGSGQMFGKGIGFGTQSKLQFLPEYHTDFIFAAFAEEWGFVGIMLLFLLFGVVFWRVLSHAMRGETNFEILFCLGLAIMLLSHFIVHVGINMGLLPVTGTTIPFMSYGGSHLLTEFIGLGIVMGMSRYERSAHRSVGGRELVGVGSLEPLF